MEQRRLTKKKRSKKKKFLIFLLIIFAIIAGITTYSIIQFNQGKKLAEKSVVDNNNNDEEFNGVEPFEGEINILLLGSDARADEQSRTDTIMIAQYDTNNETVKLISLMRDMYVQIPDYQNYKINTAYFLGGPELLRKTIKQNFGIDLNYYAVVNFQGFVDVVDVLAPEGIEIDVEKDMSAKLDVELEAGLQKLNGLELLNYARFRHDAEGDFGRVRRQQQVVSALKDEVLSLNGITKLPKLVGTITPYMETNISTMQVLSIGKEFLLNPVNDVQTLTIPIQGSYTDGNYSHAGDVLEIDFEQNKQAIDEFLNEGVDPVGQNDKLSTEEEQ
ncbi:LCP family protein [Aquibacillus kalidii]|uniref:LCP family protein n=1 Tax=Aquibacillus kalidii TaxID=2762597 RepID=UPI001647643B|nr:LCP family protein [Aquibacillus kalidii]